MRVTCYCPTYQRVPYPLEEALYCFLKQDYPAKLLIGNDDPDVCLKFDHPDIRIINHSKRFLTVYDKINHDRKEIKDGLVMPWPDDDLYAPWAVREAVECFNKGKKPYVAIIPYYKKAGVKYGIEGKQVHGSHIASAMCWQKTEHPVNMMTDYETPCNNDSLVVKLIKRKGMYAEVRTENPYYLWRYSMRNKWKRHSWKTKNHDKFKEKKRNPEIIELEPKLKYPFEPFGYKRGKL